MHPINHPRFFPHLYSPTSRIPHFARVDEASTGSNIDTDKLYNKIKIYNDKTLCIRWNKKRENLSNGLGLRDKDNTTLRLYLSHVHTSANKMCFFSYVERKISLAVYAVYTEKNDADTK